MNMYSTTMVVHVRHVLNPLAEYACLICSLTSGAECNIRIHNQYFTASVEPVNPAARNKNHPRSCQ
ncbi:hypothetical protein L208DRAFT_438781 [Tricholoma matsutake]|nr:hypothetical protein L208DRAFT_438781 [Tricholoma matsutake 945]